MTKKLKTKSIFPSPYQHREQFSEDKLAELAASIERDGLLQHVTVRPVGDRYELIAGERRWRAVGLIGSEDILARVMDVDDLTARRLCAAENLQREDLSQIEEVDAVIEMVDAEFIEDDEYRNMPKTNDPKTRVAKLLGRLHTRKINDDEKLTDSAKAFSNKFITKVERVFANLPKPMDWHSFYQNDLPLAIKLAPEVRSWAIKSKLNKSQTKALDKLPDKAKEQVKEREDGELVVSTLMDGDVPLAEMSAREISRHGRLANLEKRHEDMTLESVSAVRDRQPTVELADALEWLNRQDQCDLLLTDPPYSTDVDDINEFAKSWLPLALSKVKSTGRAYVCVGAYPEELHAYTSVAMPTQILVWTYRNTLGPSPKMGYKLNWQAILYYAMPDAPPLDCPVMVEQFSVQDINAPDGRLGDRYHAWQKPDELGKRFVNHSTNRGDLVLDPFCCTGAFLLAAGRVGRVAKGCDISDENLRIAKSRGCNYDC